MNLSEQDKYNLVETLQIDFNAKTDGGRKNLLFQHCPWCRHDGYKFGILIKPRGNKVFGASHCFHCGRGCQTLKDTLTMLGRTDLIPKETEELDGELDVELKLFEDDLDDEMRQCDMPKGYKRVFKNRYLKSRGWQADDYGYFEVGTNRGIDWKLEDYVILPVIENGIKVAYVARHTWSKDDIEEYNSKHRRQILRYRNSTEEQGTGFEKLIYNIDAIVPGETDTVIVCEGAFDVVGLTRKLELYDNNYIKAIATFGKKISKVQLLKLQQKGIKTIVLGYDQDAVDTTKQLAKELEQYFDILVASIPQKYSAKDWDEMNTEQIYNIFCNNLLTVREFNMEAEV